MFVHPVHIIIFLSLVTLGCLAWGFASSRRARRIAQPTTEGSAKALIRRVEALETIATDPSNRLSLEIDGLLSPDRFPTAKSQGLP